MHYPADKYAISSYLIKNSVGEPVNKATPRALRKKRPSFGEIIYTIKCPLNLSGKFISKA